MSLFGLPDTKEYQAQWGPDSSPPLPWTDEEVDALNRFQKSGIGHPFTCGGDRTDKAHDDYAREHGTDNGELVATRDGWKCPVCGYRQDWAHKGMIAMGRLL